MKRMLVIITVCILAVPGFISCKTVANTEAKTEETQTEAKEQLSQDSISADKFRKAFTYLIFTKSQYMCYKILASA